MLHGARPRLATSNRGARRGDNTRTLGVCGDLREVAPAAGWVGGAEGRMPPLAQAESAGAAAHGGAAGRRVSV